MPDPGRGISKVPLSGELYDGRWAVEEYSSTLLNRSQRQQRARMGGLARALKYPPDQLTQRANDANWQHWLDLVDREGKLNEAERVRLAARARRLHMTGLALRSSRVRQAAARKKSSTDNAVSAELQEVKRGASPADANATSN